MNVQDIAIGIKEELVDHRPVLIAIEGIGGSGKSTFASKLKEELGNAYVVNIDDFIIKEKISDATKSNFDRARLEQQILRPIADGQSASYQRLDWNTNTLSDPIEVPSVDYLIIEGVSSSDPSIANYYDFKIWVEAPPEIAKQRGSERDRTAGNDNDELWETWTKTYLEYKELYHPELKADFIFDNSESIR